MGMNQQHKCRKKGHFEYYNLVHFLMQFNQVTINEMEGTEIFSLNA